MEDRTSCCRWKAWIAAAAACVTAAGCAVTAQADEWSPKSLGVSGIRGIPAPVDGVVGVDGRVWSISLDGTDLSRISTQTKKGRGARLRVPGQDGLPGRAQIAAGSDGRIWLPVHGTHGWGLLRRTVDGLEQRITWLPKSVQVASSGISDLEPGPDGSMWFATSGTIGKVTAGGKVRAWRVPRDRGYPQADRPRLAIGGDGRIWFTAGGGVGSLSARGQFGAWRGVAKDPSIGLALLVRGGDDRLWAAGGADDDRLYRQEADGAWSATQKVWSELEDATAINEALAADPAAGGIFAIGARQLHGFQELDSEWFLRGGRESRAGYADQLAVEGSATPFRYRGLGPAIWDGIATSPGRYAIVPLPDGRIWVSLQDWDGWESYDKQQGTRVTPSKGRLRVGRVWRSGRTVQARVSCVGRTGGWCRTTLRAQVGHEARRVAVVLPAGPAAVRSTTTARVRLWGSQQAEIKRGRRVAVRVAGVSRRVR